MRNNADFGEKLFKWETAVCEIGDRVSSCLDSSCGVSKVSVLGPKFFILYINDICKITKLLHVVLFADDTNIFCPGDNLQK